MLVSIYGPAHDENKEDFITELSQICAKRNCPMLMGGDFNILRYNSDKNKNFSSNKFTDLFNWVINTHELRDLNMNGGIFTWSNNQEIPTLERLDRILISEDWESFVPLTTLSKIPRVCQITILCCCVLTKRELEEQKPSALRMLG